MSSESPLDAEELENVPLVRMEDVQPDRSAEKVSMIYSEEIDSDNVSNSSQDGTLETFVVDGSELHCVVDNDDSNIGSMVSIQAEEMICQETELIVPEVLDTMTKLEEPIEDVEEILIEEPQSQLINASQQNETPMAVLARKIHLLKPPPPDWPTLEILPGGVINLAEKADNNPDPFVTDKEPNNAGDMIYACAKCSQGFKYLFCLVKHVRWHEEEAQKLKLPTMKMTPIEKKMAALQERGEEMDKIMKTQKGIVDIKTEPKKKIAKHTLEKLKEKYICLHSGKRKIIQKPKIRRAPKKS